MADTAFNTLMAHQQAKSQQDFANYQASIAEQNRRISLASGVEKENKMRRRQRQFIGGQRAALAQSGVFGKSSFDVLEESMINAEMDILNTRAQAAQEGVNFLQKANVKRFEAKQYGQKARIALVRGAWEAGERVAKALVGIPSEAKANKGGSTPQYSSADHQAASNTFARMGGFGVS